MKEYVVPAVEFVEFSNDDVMVTSDPCLEHGLCLEKTCEYECPNMYGQACSGHHYN